MRRSLPALTMLILVAGALPSGTRAASPAADGQPTLAADGARVEGVPAFGNVFLIVGENTTRSLITPEHAPYLTGTIKPAAAWMESYYALVGGSLANYIGMTSGQYLRCDRNNAPPARCHQDVASIFSQLDVAGLSWQEWMESATNACAFIDSGSLWARNLYTTHHNPAVYYDSVAGGVYDKAIAPSAECLANVLPTGTTGPNDTSALDAALSSGEVGRFNLIIPNDCEQGHDPCGTTDPVRQFDAFLEREVPQIQASPAFGSDSVIMITWDEGSDPPMPDRMNILLAVIGPQVLPGTYAGGPRYDHYSLLRTLEDGFRLGHLAGAGHARVLGDIWR